MWEIHFYCLKQCIAFRYNSPRKLRRWVMDIRIFLALVPSFLCENFTLTYTERRKWKWKWNNSINIFLWGLPNSINIFLWGLPSQKHWIRLLLLLQCSSILFQSEKNVRPIRLLSILQWVSTTTSIREGSINSVVQYDFSRSAWVSWGTLPIIRLFQTQQQSYK